MDFLRGCLTLIVTTFLIATLFVYSILPKMRNIHGVNVMCFLASMIFMNISFALRLLIKISDMPTGLCPIIAITHHFAYIATFSWLNVLCFGVWRMFSSIRSPKPTPIWGKPFFYSSLYGWGIPLVIVVVGQIVQHSDVPDYVIKPRLPSEMYCWFDHKYRGSVIAYLYGPLIVMIGANNIMIVWAGIKFCQRSVESSKVTNVSRNKQRFKVILSLFVLMCLPWSIGMIFFMAGINFNRLVTGIFNALLPIFIFIILICKPSVWKMLKLKFPRMSPFFLTCEKLGSRIVCKRSKHQPLVAVEENPSNSNNTTEMNKIGYQHPAKAESTV
ncbi:hypothetical protein DAPPUDRAFT_316132 [Daphnia pulex]|uniref:G-protein coupled receptors family 2 profile 2 domain-containing protein n=1 Tax=Daphnia pulex TaxID=6669 RepID=E9GBT8_DAPPU|nr:hypothetical protein DAPPUDRAFT_316132 [Daphnia pulex]|eukprot:EFX83019.1 hypothetical protein DAPPUDRAFT_316132 [Daphnia pulex]